MKLAVTVVCLMAEWLFAVRFRRSMAVRDGERPDNELWVAAVDGVLGIAFAAVALWVWFR
jgi:hypothetical protein